MNILITGVSKGLGLEITKKLLKEGHNVFGLSRTKTEGLALLKSNYNDRLNLLNYDLVNSEDINKNIFKSFLGKTPLHAFINNAAIAYDDIITNANLNRLNDMFAVNTFTPIILTKYAIRNMILHKTKG